MEQNDLLKVKIEIDGRVYERDLDTETRIQVDPAGLNEALGTSPNRFAVWAMLEHRAQTVYDDLKGGVDLLERDLKTLEAQIYLEIMNAPAVKPPTIPMVQAMVQSDPRRLAKERQITDMQNAVLEAKDRLGQCAVGRKAIEMKQDAGLGLAYTHRKELDAKSSVNAEQFKPGAKAKA